MKQYLKYILVVVLVIATVGSTTAAYAAAEEHGRRGRGGGGTVTAVGASSITIQNRNDESVVVNVGDDTRIFLVETQSDGSLSDINVNDRVGIRGRRNDDGNVDARGIVVMPDGDHTGGRVASVNGSTISLEKRNETVTVIASTNTKVFVNGEEASLTDISQGMHLQAFGTLQEDESVSATLIIARDGRDGEQPREGRPGRGAGRGTGGQRTAPGQQT
ncbi:hypothetical protein KFU94_28875 [Chloroflexi bacterium TSY]|nr:hypothetical protein [Chloroflexi bacterium TSY]